MINSKINVQRKRPLLYATGLHGAIGSYIKNHCTSQIISVDPRKSIPSFPLSPAVLLLLGWSSNPSSSEEKKEVCFLNDVDATVRLASRFAKANPLNRIIFISTCGDIYKNLDFVATEITPPSPCTFYSEHKLAVEAKLSSLNCQSVVLRASNIWGCNVSMSRANGLVDKLLLCKGTGSHISLSCTLDTVISTLHVADLSELIMLAVDHPFHDSACFIASHQTISISEIIDSVRANEALHVSFLPNPTRSVTMVSAQKAIEFFNWNPSRYL